MMAKQDPTMNTTNVPLDFAKVVTKKANMAYADGSMMEHVSNVTQKLLKFWFEEPFTDRPYNFHEGQKQAILNTIYLHEVVQAKSMHDAWQQLAPDLLNKNDNAVAGELLKPKYEYPKYCMKMATGTGKTWVMHALLLWQYLNACAEKGEPSGRWTKNFLFVAPGLIVYERLLDAFCGKRIPGKELRDFEKSDIKSFEKLFVPPEYRSAVYGFLQNSLVRKEEFGHKVTGGGTLAVMNWHAFMNDNDQPEEHTDDDGKNLLEDLLPARPGIAAGNALETLDVSYLRGSRLDFLKELPDLMLVNDEAHHIHATQNKDEEVRWQQGIDELAKGKTFMQVDFSATPYLATGAGERQRKNYFPHIIVDYDLTTAIRAGRVKTIVIDQRKNSELSELDYNAVRDGRRVVSLSDGQRLMLRAGLERLKYLENEFQRLDASRKPKMMVVCEDTEVTPLVEQFLVDQGLSEEDVLTIDSNKQGVVGEKEWEQIKERLFAIDRNSKPRVIISVLMLREGFDVNNVCVVVPLRAAGAQILLEQTLGRGLRLMWREPEYQEIKKKARQQLLFEKSEPCAVLDFLYIIEHPRFVEFYDELLEEGLAGTETSNGTRGAGTGDLLHSILKENYEKWDLYWPIVRRESEELLKEFEIDYDSFEPFTLYPLQKLRDFFGKPGEEFVGRELTVQTTFGEYNVNANIFNANCYNEYIGGIVSSVSKRFMRIGGKQTRRMPSFQVNLSQIAASIDAFIRNKLFGEAFDPMSANDWKVLLCLNGVVTKHIIMQVGEALYRLEQSSVKIDAEVEKIPFSSVSSYIVREETSLELTKTIYTLTGFPANSGGLERDFLEFIDHDGEVERFVKINEAAHTFARIAYLRSDGLMAEYIPDFLVATADRIWLVETKAKNAEQEANVQAKRRSAIQWCATINELPACERMNRTWGYLLINHEEFYAAQKACRTFKDLCVKAELTAARLVGEFSFV